VYCTEIMNKGWDWHSATPAEKQVLEKNGTASIRQEAESDSEDMEEVQCNNGPPKPELDNMELPAMFWDEMPENASDHPDYMAMEALRAECTPEELANTAKVRNFYEHAMRLEMK